MNKAIERMKGGNALVEDAGEISAYTRQTLSMLREARREVYGDQWRDQWQEIAEDFNDDDASESDALTLDGDGESLAMVRGFSARLTFGDFDGEGGED